MYRAAVIGLGRIGFTMEADSRRPKPATHVGAWLACPRADLVGVCDVDRARVGAAECWPVPPRPAAIGISFSVTAGAILEEEPDIVSIATPPETHRALVEECAAAWVKAVVCEKPLALSAWDCRQMIAACKQAGTRLFVDHSRRFDPVLRLAASEVPRRLGEITAVVGHYSGSLWESGPHILDLARMMTHQEIGSVLGFSEKAAVIELGPAPLILVVHDAADYAIFELHVYGRKGALLVTDSGYTVAWQDAVDHPYFTGYRGLGPRWYAQGFARSFLAPMAEHVCDVLDGKAEPASTGEDGLAVVRVLEALSA